MNKILELRDVVVNNNWFFPGLIELNDNI